MRVMIFAYLDNNIGDDLMLALLARRFPGHQFYLYTANSVVRENLSKFHNFVLRTPDQRRFDLDLVDVVLSIGGSIFNDLNSFRGKFARIRKIAFLIVARLKGKKIATIGCNLGPYNDSAGFWLTILELKLNSLVTVRDAASHALISDGFVTNFHLADDIVYGIDVLDSSIPRSGLGVSAFRSTHVAETNSQNYAAIASLIDRYIDEVGGSVKIFAFDTECENDLSAAFHILSLVENKQNVRIIPYLGNIDEFLIEFDGCQVQLAIRFHAAVLSDALGIKFFPVSYSNKMDSLISDKFPFFKSINLASLINGSAVVADVAKSIVEDVNVCQGRRSKGNSHVHFDQLEAILNEE